MLASAYGGSEFGLKLSFWRWQGARPLEAPETGTLQPPRALLRPFGGFVQPPGQKNWNFFLKKSNVPKTPQYSKKTLNIQNSPRNFEKIECSKKPPPIFKKNPNIQKNPVNIQKKPQYSKNPPIFKKTPLQTNSSLGTFIWTQKSSCPLNNDNYHWHLNLCCVTNCILGMIEKYSNYKQSYQ